MKSRLKKMNTTEQQIKVLQAFKEGKAVEMLCENYLWKEIKEEVADFYPFNFATETYRVKPKIRPYKSAKEFIHAQMSHGPFIAMSAKESLYELPMVVCEGCVTFRYNKHTYCELVGLHWQDGTPCGIEE